MQVHGHVTSVVIFPNMFYQKTRLALFQNVFYLQIVIATPFECFFFDNLVLCSLFALFCVNLQIVHDADQENLFFALAANDFGASIVRQG